MTNSCQLQINSRRRTISSNSNGAGTREVHNKMEKNRRAQLKECFETLRKQLPPSESEKKASNLSILGSACRTVHSLKRKERELELEMERLAKDKVAHQKRIMMLRREIIGLGGDGEIAMLAASDLSESGSSGSGGGIVAAVSNGSSNSTSSAMRERCKLYDLKERIVYSQWNDVSIIMILLFFLGAIDSSETLSEPAQLPIGIGRPRFSSTSSMVSGATATVSTPLAGVPVRVFFAFTHLCGFRRL